MKAKESVGPPFPPHPLVPSRNHSPYCCYSQAQGACRGWRTTTPRSNNNPPPLVNLVSSCQEINYLDISGVYPRGSWCAFSFALLGGDQVGAHGGFLLCCMICMKISMCQDFMHSSTTEMTPLACQSGL